MRTWFTKGRFREDLFYRINVVLIMIPALRTGRADLPLLLTTSFAFIAQRIRNLKQLQPEVIGILRIIPGREAMRELENIVQRMVVMNDGAFIAAHHLPQHLLYSSAASQEAILIPKEAWISMPRWSGSRWPYLNAALRRTGGKDSAAAELLRLDPQRMKYLCRTLKIETDVAFGKGKRVNK